MRLEAWIEKLKIESNALKQSFKLSNYQVDVYEKSASINTTENAITVGTQYGNQINRDPERVEVTFTTHTGVNTLAKLEFSCSDPSTLPKIRQVPYTGGARWIVTKSPLYDNTTWNWMSTHYDFSVKSLVNGTISLKEMTS